MRMPLIEGADFRLNDTSPGVAIVNETFVRQYFDGRSPLGQTFAKGRARYRVVGVVRDAPYRSLREPILPVAYVPFHPVDAAGVPQPVREATFIVRTSSANPLALASTLRQEIPRARPEFRVSNLEPRRIVRGRPCASACWRCSPVLRHGRAAGGYWPIRRARFPCCNAAARSASDGDHAQAGDIARRVTGGLRNGDDRRSGLALGCCDSVRRDAAHHVKHGFAITLPMLVILAAAFVAPPRSSARSDRPVAMRERTKLLSRYDGVTMETLAIIAGDMASRSGYVQHGRTAWRWMRQPSPEWTTAPRTGTLETLTATQ